MRNLLRALHRRYRTRGLTPEERARLDALPAAHWPTTEEFASDVEELRARIAAVVDPPWSRPDANPLADMREAARRAHEDWLPADENTAARAEVATGLVPATAANVTAALYPPPALPEEDLARIRQADRERRALAELDRMRTERITYTIDWTREQWLTLVRHGIDPALPRHVEGGRIVAGLLPADDSGGFRVVDVPTRRERICELDGVEIDGHEASDLDPWGGCIHCGKEEIYGDDHLDDECSDCQQGDGVHRPGCPALGDDDPEADAAWLPDPDDITTWPFADGSAR